MTLLTGYTGGGHSKMIYSCDWNENGILTTGLDRNLCLWNVNMSDL